MVFRRDDHNDDEVEEKISQFRRQLDTLSEDEPNDWDDATEMDWQDQPSADAEPEFMQQHDPQPADQIRASVVAGEATWTGTLQSDGPITIYGTFNGEILASGDVHIAPGAVVQAQIQAENLEIAGSVQGSIQCSNRFLVLESGWVRGEIVAPVLVVHDGATVEGQFRMEDENGDEEDDAEQ